MEEEIKITDLAADAQDMEARTAPIITARQLVDFEYPQTKWLVKDLIPATGFTAITGAPYSYKSFITQHLALCIALNKPLFNHFEVAEGTVLIVDKENAKSLIKDRLLKLGFEGNPPIYFLNNPEKYNLSDPATLAWTIEFVKTHLVSLIILDSFVHIHRGDENDSQAIAKTFEALKQIPCPIVFIHHHRKTIKFFTGTILESIRGSSDIGAELEAHLAIDSMTDGSLRVTQGKNRWGMLTKPFTVSPVFTDNLANFIYEGEIEEEISKVQKARGLIIEYLQNVKESSRQLLLQALSETSGRNSIDQALKQMETNNELKIRYEKKAKYISLCPGLCPSQGDTEFSASEQYYLENAE